jgi:hypothetical protein
MEDLIAKYPYDFFPRRKLILKDRQGSFQGVGRFDLLFKDEFNTNILMELKAQPAKYIDATQLEKYKGALNNLGNSNIIMWLVAPLIPTSVREFLDRIGIEYTEIHENEYRNIAKRRNEKISSEIESFDSRNNDLKIESKKLQNSFFPNNKTSYPNRIQPKFRLNRKKLRNNFPGAYNFLCYSQNYVSSGLSLSTSTNAHLYFKTNFLMYIKLKSNSIIISPNFNGRINENSMNKSNKIFPEIFKTIKEMEGFSKGWAISNIDDILLNSRTPPTFFDKLIKICTNSI